MASPGAKWPLSILLLILTTPLALAGPPAPPSAPDCYLPQNENEIHCMWDPGPEPQLPTDYTLNWKHPNSKAGHVRAQRVGGIIPRHEFTSHDDLHVWVSAANHHGSTLSQEIAFNVAHIIKPPPPIVSTVDSAESLEISWNYLCLGFPTERCDVRHRTKGDQDWPEEEDGIYGSYSLDSPEPYTLYEFQVRCACAHGLMSDWSKIHTVQSAEAAPIGALDVWRDCGLSLASSDCVLMWKILPRSLARGHILRYEISLTHSNGTSRLLNLSIAEPGGQLVCEETKCHFSAPLNSVSSVNVLAYSAQGATLPARLAMPAAGKGNSEQDISIAMTTEYLNVSWDQQPQLSDTLKEYVVQYKRAGGQAAQGFDWIRVNKNETSAVFKGMFENYMAYEVTLFALTHGNKVFHVSSAIGYSHHGVPSPVSSVEVVSVNSTHVTLSWQTVPMLEQNGEILYYQVGLDRENVYNVSGPPQNGKKTFLLQHLRPAQDYTVWVRAVTAAGPGEKTIRTFKTKEREAFAGHYLIQIIPPFTILVLMAVIFAVVHFFSRKYGPVCSHKNIPDPSKCQIFTQMNHQLDDSLTWICVPIHEPVPAIAVLEVLEIQHPASKSHLVNSFSTDSQSDRVVGDDCSQTNKHSSHEHDSARKLNRDDGTEDKFGRAGYSKMLDSEEEEDREEMDQEENSSSDDEVSLSGYEKHFMPTAQDVLEDS